MIEIKNLTIKFNQKTVLESINLQIPDNQISIIIGQSGCGKSVLMKTIEALIKPYRGTVIFDGVDVFNQNSTGLKEIRQKIAMLFQGSALLDSLNVYQNIALPLHEHTKLSQQEITKEVEKTLQMVGLGRIFSKMPSELSGGMKKRVALARAIIRKPKYVIYDEPTTGLDPVIAHNMTE